MPVSKILQQELTSAGNTLMDLFAHEPPIEDYYLRDRLGGDYERLGVIKKDLHVRSCLERRAQAITARERTFTAASTYEQDIHIATLARWCADNLAWDAAERRLWEGAYLNGRSHAEILWQTIDTPRGLLEGEVNERTGDMLRPPYPYELITIPVAIRSRAPQNFVFRQPGRQAAKQIKDATGLLGRSLRLPSQTVEGWGLRYLTTAAPVDGVPAPVFKFISHAWGSETSNPNGKGVGGDLYWPVLLKKEFIAYWTVYGDKYADPGKVGNYPDGGDPNILAEFFKSYGRDSWASLPEGYRVSLLEAQRGGTVNTYESFVRWLDDQISQLITGQAYGNSAGQGLSGQPARNDENIRKEWVKADADLICPAMRRDLLTPLTLLNIPTAEAPQYWRDFGDQEDLNERSERDHRLFGMGYRLRADAVRRVYGDDYTPVEDENPQPPPEPLDPEGDDSEADLEPPSPEASGDAPSSSGDAPTAPVAADSVERAWQTMGKAKGKIKPRQGKSPASSTQQPIP